MRRVISDREGQPDGAPRQAEHQALGEQDAHQPAAAGAEGGPDAELALAHGGPRQQQVGDVGAGEQEEEQGRRHQHAGGGEVGVGAGLRRVVGGGGGEVEVALAVRQRRRLVEGAGGARQGLARLPGVDPRGEAAEQAHQADVPRGEPRQAGQPVGLGQRHVDRRGVAVGPESRRQDADQREGLGVEPQRPADRGGIAAQRPHPEIVADHRHRLGAGQVVRRPEQAAALRPGGEEREETAAHQLSPGEGRGLALPDRGGEGGEADEVGHGGLAAAGGRGTQGWRRRCTAPRRSRCRPTPPARGWGASIVGRRMVTR